MTNDDLLREVLINRMFLIVLFMGGGFMFLFIGIMAWWSVRTVRRPLAEFTLLSQLLIQWLKSQKREE